MSPTNHQQHQNDDRNQGWSIGLVLCLVVTCAAQFQYGFNIGVTNLPTQIIKAALVPDKFALVDKGSAILPYKKMIFNSKKARFEVGKAEYEKNYARYIEGREKFNKTKADLARFSDEGNTTARDIIYDMALAKNSEYMEKYDMTVEAFLMDAGFKLGMAKKRLDNASALLAAGKARLDNGTATLEAGEKKLTAGLDILWTIVNVLFVLGGMIGAICSKSFADFFGRRNSIIVHNVFSIVGAAFVFLMFFVEHFSLVMLSRFFFGVQGGMACSLTPTYLMEISPSRLRGATGVFNQLCLTLGIMVSQLLGFRQILGTKECWKILLALPLFMSLFCSLFLVFFPETKQGTWRQSKKYDPKSASFDMRSPNGQDEAKESEEAISFKQLFRTKNLRWPLITGIALQLAQQLSGINAIFFYSESIFKNAGVQPEQIQYAVLLTGVINVVATIVAIPLIEKLGRKPLVVFPMIVMTVDFVLLTIFLIFQETSAVISYFSIACIIVFIICFALGLGPIPFVYVAECFKQNAKSAAMAVCMLTNWFANLLLTLAFPFLAKFLGNYVFLVFVAIVGLLLAFVWFKVPETKNKSQDQIMAEFGGAVKLGHDDHSRNPMLSHA